MYQKTRKAISLLILATIVYYFRPWFQELFLGFYMNPFIVQALVAGLLVGGVVFLATGDNMTSADAIAKGKSGTAFVITASVFLVLGGVLNTPFTSLDIADDLGENAVEIDSLPDIDNENPRILPRSVANEFAENSLQEPRHRLGTGDIAIDENGTPQWSYPLKPDGTLNTFILNQKGSAFVDMTTSSSNLRYNSQEMEVGIGMQIRDNVNWQQRKERFWVNYEDHINLEYEGENYIATPYKDYSFRFRFPIFYTVPEWGGVALVDSDGSIEYVDSEDVESHEVLSSQRTYPFELAHRYVSAMEYRNGIMNKWFLHEDQLEVAPVPGFDNDQPFMILTEENPKLFVATEPYGDASGLFEIWTIDAVTGEYELFRLERDEGLIGANRAVNFVRRANSRVNWADRESDTGFVPVEPIPVIVDERLYWQVRVIPLDSAGIAFTSFVDARTSNVYTAESDEDIIDFLEGEELDETVVDEEEPVTQEGIEVTILQDGEVVERFHLEDRDFDIQVRED